MHRIFVWPKYNHKWIKCVQLGILWPGSDAFSAFYPRINYYFSLDAGWRLHGGCVLTLITEGE